MAYLNRLYQAIFIILQTVLQCRIYIKYYDMVDVFNQVHVLTRSACLRVVRDNLLAGRPLTLLESTLLTIHAWLASCHSELHC